MKQVPPLSKKTSAHRQTLEPSSLAYALVQSAQLVAQVLEGQSLADVFEVYARNQAWTDSVRGAVRDLSAGCLRDYRRGDLILAKLLDTPLPAELHAVLLVALHRLRTRPDQPHTIVDQAVEAFASLAPGLRGVANGVLRNAQRRSKEFEEDIRLDLAARYAHPLWWIEMLRADHPDDWEQILDAGNQKPPMSLRINHRHDVERTLGALVEQCVEFGRHANGALVLSKPYAVSQLPGFAEGWCSVQDAGAQWAAPCLDLADGQRVLDACAAPGGKVAHILESADVALTAVEIDPRRIARIRSNFQRLGLTASKLINADVSAIKSWWDGEQFDRILADVPCSASGIVRRHPDIKWLRRSEDIARFARQQGRILDALWPTLKPGGKLLYVTCSVFEQENTKQIAHFCDRHPDAHRLSLDDGPGAYVLPNGENDGFYYALVQKHD